MPRSSSSPSERRVLLAPDAVARAAIPLAPDAEARWMLRQPRAVRESFVRRVLEKRDPPPREQIWMLLQKDEIRESYAREVLLAGDGYAAGGS